MCVDRRVGGGYRLATLAVFAVGCRDPNPYFVEPPLPTSSGGASEGMTGTTTEATGSGGPTTTTTTGSSGPGTGSATETDTGTVNTTTGTTSGGVCSDGEIVCEGATEKVCDGAGGFKSSQVCPSQCVPALGCVLCAPKAMQCVGELLQACADDGGAWADLQTCDALQGLVCDAVEGSCAGACAPDLLGRRQVGCDFYSTSLANLQSGGWLGNYGVIAVNTGDADAEITITRGAQVVSKVSVAPLAAKSIVLSYVAEVSQSGQASVLVAEGAYRLRSTQPLAVYQFEPLGENGTGDASLLFPVHTWGEEHVIASWPFWFSEDDEQELGGLYAVIASEDNTQVTVTPASNGGAVAAGMGVVDGAGNGVLVMDAGSVMEVFSATGGDLTGTRVVADRPVSVFGGHRCGQVPIGTPFCDHLEDAIPPITALAKQYLVVPPRGPDNQDRTQVIRIMATEADTQISYSPDMDVKNYLTTADDWLQIGPTNEMFAITADKKVMVAQYMTGGNPDTDPSMALAIPTQQFNDVYRVAASTMYVSRWLTVVAPNDASVLVDGVNIGELVQIGQSGFSSGTIALPNTASGANLLTGDKPFGAMIYGHGPTTSYWYPAGLELQLVP
jgi:hypothetical protein